MTALIALSIPAPAEQHDPLLRSRVAPVIRAFRDAPPASLVWFERANKPDWNLRVLAAGDAAWLEAEVRPAFSEELGVTTGAARFVDVPHHDKWTGGPEVAGRLHGFLRADTRAALDALDADARGALGSRATFSLLVVEGLLDALAIHDQRRLDFYRESFTWEIEHGRWDRTVVDSLERTFASRREDLAALVSGEPARWPSPEAERIGRTLLAQIDEWRRSSSPGAELALPAARGHSNRLGIHGGREAALRYLVWRARGGAFATA